jgi:hypothetical protein
MTTGRAVSIIETNICSVYAPWTATQRLAEGE